MWLLIPVMDLALSLFVAYSVLSQGVSGQGVGSAPKILHDASQVATSPGTAQPLANLPPVVSGVPPTMTQAGAIAHAKEAGVDFNKPYNREAAEVQRPIEQLRLSRGVYSDRPEDSQHYTEKDLEIQARAVWVLKQRDSDRIYSASIIAARENANIPVTFNKPDLAGSYQITER